MTNKLIKKFFITFTFSIFFFSIHSPGPSLRRIFSEPRKKDDLDLNDTSFKETLEKFYRIMEKKLRHRIKQSIIEKRAIDSIEVNNFLKDKEILDAGIFFLECYNNYFSKTKENKKILTTIDMAKSEVDLCQLKHSIDILQESENYIKFKKFLKDFKNEVKRDMQGMHVYENLSQDFPEYWREVISNLDSKENFKINIKNRPIASDNLLKIKIKFTSFDKKKNRKMSCVYSKDDGFSPDYYKKYFEKILSKIKKKIYENGEAGFNLQRKKMAEKKKEKNFFNKGVVLRNVEIIKNGERVGDITTMKSKKRNIFSNERNNKTDFFPHIRNKIRNDRRAMSPNLQNKTIKYNTESETITLPSIKRFFPQITKEDNITSLRESKIDQLSNINSTVISPNRRSKRVRFNIEENKDYNIRDSLRNKTILQKLKNSNRKQKDKQKTKDISTKAIFHSTERIGPVNSTFSVTPLSYRIQTSPIYKDLNEEEIKKLIYKSFKGEKIEEN